MAGCRSQAADGSDGYRHPVMLGDVSRAMRLVRNEHAGSKKNLLGETSSDELARKLSGELTVTARTPPVFLWHTVEDKSVKLAGVLDLAASLDRQGRPFELHVYEKGSLGLGLGTRPYDPAKLHPWTAECRRWLAERDFGTK